jgi:tetratricopeptide (TPR) repeat protein
MSERTNFYLEKLKGNPENLLNRFSLAQTYYESGEYEQAIDHLTICFERREDWMMASLLLSKALIAVGQKQEARQPLEQTIILAREQGHDDPEEEAKALLLQCARPDVV